MKLDVCLFARGKFLCRFHGIGSVCLASGHHPGNVGQGTYGILLREMLLIFTRITFQVRCHFHLLIFTSLIEKNPETST